MVITSITLSTQILMFYRRYMKNAYNLSVHQ